MHERQREQMNFIDLEITNANYAKHVKLVYIRNHQPNSSSQKFSQKYPTFNLQIPQH